jgi:glycosyltransferase involved in cell wall biosynthesis
VREIPETFEPRPARRPSLRVAVVTETYPPEVNGVAMTLGRMVAALEARRHRVQLIRPRQGAADAAATRENFEEILAPGLPIPRYDGLRIGLPARRLLLAQWRQRRPDVVQVVTEGPLGWSAIAAARRLRIPVASEFHTNFHRYSRHYGAGWLGRPIAAYLRTFHNRALVTLVPTHEMRDALTAYGYRNVRVVARGVDTRMFSPAHRSSELRRTWGAGDDDPVALVVGRIAPEKNLSLVLSAFAVMRERNPRSKLVFVGDGPERAELQRRFPEHVFSGMRTGADLARHYASGDVFLFGSLTETFGNVTLEAMASGLAVVAYDYAAARQHIRHDGNGLVAPSEEGQAFERLAGMLASDPVRVRVLGMAARATAEGVDWESVHDDLETVLAELAAPMEPGGAR